MMLNPQLVADIRDLGAEEGARIVRPGKSKVWRENGEIKVEMLQ